MVAERKILDGKILIVDDQLANVQLLEKFLECKGYRNLRWTTDSREVLQIYREFQPDLVLLDLRMPFLDGFDVMKQLNAAEKGSYAPILVLTAQPEHQTRLRALEAGARDVLVKPFDLLEVGQRISHMLEIRILHNEVLWRNKTLEDLIQKRSQELVTSRLEMLQKLARAAEYRDNHTGLHILRMSRLCVRLAQAMGWEEETCEQLYHASALHDVGKIGIPDEVLLKPGTLTPEEWVIMKKHPVIGAEILSGDSSEVLKMAQTIALTHHERWDGMGYPYSLKTDDIPEPGQIVALCDVFDALTSERPYKRAWAPDQAMRYLEDESGKAFNPHLISVFKASLPEMVLIQEQFSDDKALPAATA